MIKFQELSPYTIKAIQNLTYDPNASCKYELFSGGLYWSDEMTHDIVFSLIDDNNYLFRYLIAYRASLMTSSERKELHTIWETMQTLFPNWPGFRPERCSTKLKDALLLCRKKSDDEINEIDDEDF